VATSDAMLSAAGLLMARATLERWLTQTRRPGQPGDAGLAQARSQFGAIWEQVAERLLPIIEAEATGLDEAERVRVVNVVVGALNAAYLDAPPSDAIEHLTPPGQDLYRRLLEEAGRCIATDPADAGPAPPVQLEGEHPAIALLNEWLADESGYDEETLPKLKRALDEDRLGYRKFYEE